MKQYMQLSVEDLREPMWTVEDAFEVRLQVEPPPKILYIFQQDGLVSIA